MNAQSMTKQVLFIQGAGDGAYEEDTVIADMLRGALGDRYTVRYPRMPDDDASDVEWTRRIGEEIAASGDGALVVAHSFGGTALVKYLAETLEYPRIAGVFLMGVPLWGVEGGWQYEGFAIAEDFHTRLPKDVPTYLYHNRDDDTVPLAHVEGYAARLPNVTVREGERGGHQFEDGVRHVAQDIKALA